ncbi:MAG: right-handed parallel beta-helix repeat-containing protein [Candidatus Lokiarchaeota archaeon]|nr:right-handed parallel beta-helix repeat-containing protein [Candidatus Lokiarchaeota archaeon]
MSGNIANYNNKSGIYLDSSENNAISGNVANYNNKSGIFLYYGNNNSLSGNTANNNYCGINLTSSNFNYIIGNIIFDNNVCIIEDEFSLGNFFSDNKCIRDDTSDDDNIRPGIIGAIITSIILVGLSVLYWQLKRKDK